MSTALGRETMVPTPSLKDSTPSGVTTTTSTEARNHLLERALQLSTTVSRGKTRASTIARKRWPAAVG